MIHEKYNFVIPFLKAFLQKKEKKKSEYVNRKLDFSSVFKITFKLSNDVFSYSQHTRCTREQAPYRLVGGQKYITETCQGLKFQISPDSFFQVNLLVSETICTM